MKEYILKDVCWLVDKKCNYVPFIINKENNKIKLIFTDKIINLDGTLQTGNYNYFNEKDKELLNNVLPNCKLADNHMEDLTIALSKNYYMATKEHFNFHFSKMELKSIANKMTKHLKFLQKRKETDEKIKEF